MVVLNKILRMYLLGNTMEIFNSSEEQRLTGNIRYTYSAVLEKFHINHVNSSSFMSIDPSCTIPI